MTVYVVTSGEYSDYRIEKIFSDRKKAHLYSLLDEDRRVEEYDMDDCELNISKGFLRLTYNYRYNHFYGITLTGKQIKPKISSSWHYPFEFTIPLSNERVYKNIVRYGKDSKVILKIAQDKFAEYCYEHGTSREELIRQQDEEAHRKAYGYDIATTSSIFTFDGQFRKKLEVNERVATALKQMIVDGKPLPPTEELQTIYDLTTKEVQKEHEQDELR